MDRGERQEQWIVSEALRRRMTEVARDFRKTPTASEAILWEALRGKSISGLKLRRQQPIGPFVVDFYTATARLVVEVDGAVHHEKREIDRERQLLIESLGVRFVRIASELVENDLALALGRIRDALGAPPLSPRPFLPPGEKGEEPGTTLRFPAGNGDQMAPSDSSLLVVPLSPLVGERGRGG